MRAGLCLLLLASIPLLGGFALLRAEDRDVARGIAHYGAGAYDEALAAYRTADARGAGGPGLDLNRGAALYQLAKTSEGGARRQHLEDAADRFERAASANDRELWPRARYNLGNTRFRQGRYAEAAEAYKAALRVDSSHADARHNLALALRARDQAAALKGRAGEGALPPDARDAGASPSDAREGRNEEAPAGGDLSVAPDGELVADETRAGQGGEGPAFRRAPDREDRARAPLSHDDVERKLDELERLSRQIWLERVRSRAASAPAQEARP